MSLRASTCSVSDIMRMGNSRAGESGPRWSHRVLFYFPVKAEKGVQCGDRNGDVPFWGFQDSFRHSLSSRTSAQTNRDKFPIIRPPLDKNLGAKAADAMMGMRC